MAGINKITGKFNLPEVPKIDQKPKNVSFGDTLKNFVNDVNDLQFDADKSVERLLTGEIKDIHDVMIAVEKAGVSFELMMEIRNKMIDAYNEFMRMQV